MPAVDGFEGRDGLLDVVVENCEVLLLKITNGRPGGWTHDCIQIDSLAWMRSRIDFLGRDIYADNKTTRRKRLSRDAMHMRFSLYATVGQAQFTPARVLRTGDALLVRRNSGLGGVLVSLGDYDGHRIVGNLESSKPVGLLSFL